MVRVRFAPSPTGFLHIGGARTALFNWMYARAQNGKFILRIEDTDKVRSKQEYFDEILDSMKWLGLNWDEFYKQSDRFDIYKKYAQQLLDEGKAYKDGEAIILKVQPKLIKMYDLIRDEIQIDSQEIKDQVLMKSDGSPTYSFACVIDDALMEISCVIRGEDHISNTPKQILIYEALGFKPPKFAHLPLILDDERARLSKRAGAVAVTDYRRQGFLPEAIVNYLMLLGWSPGDNQEIIGLNSALKKFSIKRINKTGAAFSIEKLKWVNSQYIRQLSADQLIEFLKPFLQEKGYLNGKIDGERLKNIVQLYKGRISTLLDFLDWTEFIFADNFVINEEIRAKHLSQSRQKEFALLSDRFKKLENFDAPSIEKAFRDSVAELGLQASELVHPMRVSLTGNEVGPGLFETIAVLGKEKTIQRLSQAFR